MEICFALKVSFVQLFLPCTMNGESCSKKETEQNGGELKVPERNQNLRRANRIIVLSGNLQQFKKEIGLSWCRFQF
jgi:hypothetical protein